MLRRTSFLQMLAGLAGVGALTGAMLAFSVNTAQAGAFECEGSGRCDPGRCTCTIRCKEACECTNSNCS